MNSNLLLNVVSFHVLVLLIPLALALLFFKPEAWYATLAFCTGVVMGFVALHSTEPQLPATLLLLFGIFLGSARPAQAWLWGILLAVWVPVGSFLGIFIQGRMQALLYEGVGSFLAFAFSFAGSYLGALVAKYSRPG